MSLPLLPSYIELRSPSPELAPLEVPTFLSPRLSLPTFDRKSNEPTFQDAEYDIETAGNAFLRDLKFVESFKDFRTPNWDGPTMTEVKFDMDPFGNVRVEQDDSLGTFADRIYDSVHPSRRVSYLEIVLMLVSRDCFSTSHFLETVIRKADGSEVEILKWLARNIDIPKFGARALGKAACLNNFEAVGILLDMNVDINGSVYYPHFTPECFCHISIIAYAQIPRLDRQEPGANDEMVAYFLARGAVNPTGANMCLMGLLRCVLQQQNIRERVFLSKVQAVVEQIHGFADVVCETGSILETCIFEWELDDTCAEGRYQVLDYLLDQGAKTCPGSPLAASIYMGDPEVLHWDLLAKTENINAYCTLNHRCEKVSRRPQEYDVVEAVAPLQAAALRGNETIIRILLQKGADVNCPARGVGGVTPLQAICYLEERRTRDRMKKMRLVKLLIDYGANANAAPAWWYGLTALQAAAFVGDVQVADLLVCRGADVNAPACTYGGGTALELAVRQGHVDMVRFLFKAGAVVPADMVEVSTFTNVHAYHSKLVELLRISAEELEAMGVVNNNSSRDYHEYEAEWADDPTYGGKG